MATEIKDWQWGLSAGFFGGVLLYWLVKSRTSPKTSRGLGVLTPEEEEQAFFKFQDDLHTAQPEEVPQILAAVARAGLAPELTKSLHQLARGRAPGAVIAPITPTSKQVAVPTVSTRTKPEKVEQEAEALAKALVEGALDKQAGKRAPVKTTAHPAVPPAQPPARLPAAPPRALPQPPRSASPPASPGFTPLPTRRVSSHAQGKVEVCDCTVDPQPVQAARGTARYRVRCGSARTSQYIAAAEAKQRLADGNKPFCRQMLKPFDAVTGKHAATKLWTDVRAGKLACGRICPKRRPETVVSSSPVAGLEADIDW